MAMTPGLHHVDIITPDLRRSLSFYQDILGMKLAGWFFREELFEFLFLRDSPPSSLFCLEFCGPPLLGWQERMLDQQGACIDHLSMLAEDIDAWYERLKEQGIPFLQPPEPVLGAREMYFRDPSHTILEILTPEDPGLTPLDIPAFVRDEAQPLIALHHVSLLTSDPQALAAFYMQEFDFISVPAPPGSAAGIFLTDSSQLHRRAVTRPMVRVVSAAEVGAGGTRSSELSAGLYQIALTTENLEQAQSALRKKGAAVELMLEPAGCERLRLTDPYGIEIAIFRSASLPH
jgi:glyoxylase I family protein